MVKSKPRFYSLYWLLFFIVLVLLSVIYDGDLLGGVYLNLTRIPVLFLLAYLVFFVIGNRSDWGNLYKGIAIILALVVAVLLSRVIFALIVFPYYFSENYTFTFFNWHRLVSQLLIFTAGLGGYGLLIYYTEKERWKKRQQVLIEARKSSELNFLKAQVQPHFLHNTLNGIYNEVIKKTDKAGEMIIKLSELMRFMLQEGKHDFIGVAKEITLIENYIDLELLRFGDQVKISSNIDDNCLGSKVSPLLFFSLIENSFKHGIGFQQEGTFIHYELFEDKGSLCFKVENSFQPNAVKSSVKSDGIGLRNIKRQLELIYGNNYYFNQHIDNHVFVSLLKIPFHA